MKGLKFLYRLWMKFARFLGWVNTHLLLTLLYGVIFTPLGFLLRLFGKDLLDESFEERKSYWTNRPETPPREQYLKPY